VLIDSWIELAELSFLYAGSISCVRASTVRFKLELISVFFERMYFWICLLGVKLWKAAGCSRISVLSGDLRVLA
jgi:hypothetical protein